MTIHHVLGLVHYPCLGKEGEVQSTSIFNVDVHDNARVVSTYGLDAFHVIHPVDAQREMVEAMTGFWKTDKARLRNPDRAHALSKTHAIASIEESIKWIQAHLSDKYEIVVTSAIAREQNTGYGEMRALIEAPESTDKTYLWLFGTGHGLADVVMEMADHTLAPLYGPTAYNHLSVRAAIAIILDRLFAVDAPAIT